MKILKFFNVCILILLITFIFTGCGNAEKEKYVGKWKAELIGLNGKPYSEFLEITTQDGKVYGITLRGDKGEEWAKENAVLKEKYLEVNPYERLVIGPDGTLPFRNGNFKKIENK